MVDGHILLQQAMDAQRATNADWRLPPRVVAGPPVSWGKPDRPQSDGERFLRQAMEAQHETDRFRLGPGLSIPQVQAASRGPTGMAPEKMRDLERVFGVKLGGTAEVMSKPPDRQESPSGKSSGLRSSDSAASVNAGRTPVMPSLKRNSTPVPENEWYTARPSAQAAAREALDLTCSGADLVHFMTPDGTMHAISEDALLRMLEWGRSGARHSRARRGVESQVDPETNAPPVTLDILSIPLLAPDDEGGDALSAGGVAAGLLALLATLGVGYYWLQDSGCQTQAQHDCELYCQRIQGRGLGAVCLYPNRDCTCGGCKCPCTIGGPGSDDGPGGGPIVIT